MCRVSRLRCEVRGLQPLVGEDCHTSMSCPYACDTGDQKLLNPSLWAFWACSLVLGPAGTCVSMICVWLRISYRCSITFCPQLVTLAMSTCSGSWMSRLWWWLAERELGSFAPAFSPNSSSVRAVVVAVSVFKYSRKKKNADTDTTQTTYTTRRDVTAIEFMSLCVSVCVSVCGSVCVFLSASVQICLCPCPCVCLPKSLPVQHDLVQKQCRTPIVWRRSMLEHALEL